MVFHQSHGWGSKPRAVWGKSISGGETSKCRGLERRVSPAGAQWDWSRVREREERGQGLPSALKGPHHSRWWPSEGSEPGLIRSAFKKMIVLAVVCRTDCRGQEWKQKGEIREFPAYQLWREGGLNREVVVERGKEGCIWNSFCHWVDRTCWRIGYWMWQEDRSKGRVPGFWPEQPGNNVVIFWNGEDWGVVKDWRKGGMASSLWWWTCEVWDTISVQLGMSRGQVDVWVWSLGERSGWRYKFWSHQPKDGFKAMRSLGTEDR